MNRLWALIAALSCLHACQKTPSAPAYRARVVIVGGGVAGVVTAYELEKQGVSTHIIEERNGFGGRVDSAHYDAVEVAEAGMQEIWANNPLMHIANELAVPLEGGESAFSSVILDGKLYPFVQDSRAAFFASMFDKKEMADLETWRARAAQLHQAAHVAGLADPNVAALQTLSFAEWVAQSKLSPRASTWLRLTVECEMASDWRQFSALSALLELDLFLGEGIANYHVRGGNLRLLDAMVQRLHGPHTLGATVTHVKRTRDANGRFAVSVLYQKDHRTSRVDADWVVVAVPFTRLHQIVFEPPLPADDWLAINSLRLGQYTVVHLRVDPTQQLFAANQNPFPILAGNTLGVVYGPMSTAHATPGVFSLLLYGQAARAFHMVPRETQVAQLINQLSQRWPKLPGAVQDAYVYSYHPTALPVWPPGRSAIDAMADTLRQPTYGLHLAGDYTRGAHSSGAAQRGIEVARAVQALLK